MRTILIAGASGFIGRELTQKLLKQEDIQIVALSRRDKKSDHPRLVWKKCDLYSLKDVREAMAGCEAAYYLVHSMAPSAGLIQGTFYDFDLIMADNFVRAASVHSVKRIIYLGGLVPDDQRALSWHLRSRLEVELTLRDFPGELIALRAGLIIGREGSSFFILRRLVERLPMMILPSWTKTLTEPIALEDMIRVLVHALKIPLQAGVQFDIGGKEKLTYRDLILKAVWLFQKRTPTFSLDLISIRFSRFWVSLVTGASRSLVYPLVLSLNHEMLVDPKRAWPFAEDIQESLDHALLLALNGPIPRMPSAEVPVEHDVRSVQRLPLPPGKSAEWVCEEYFRWLLHAMRPLMKVKREGNTLTFLPFGLPLPLLILEKSADRSTSDRQLLYIRGGILAKNVGRGRLEFREVLGKQYVMAAIHEYRPSLPWAIYRVTQAKIHLWIMLAFGRHLKHV